MAGFFDGLFEGTQNPLFLGGIGLMSGGFEGMAQGMQTGAGLQDRLRKQQKQQQQEQALKGALAGMPDLNDTDRQFLGSNPDAAYQALSQRYANKFDPMAPIRMQSAKAQLAQTQQENQLFPLKMQQMQAEIAATQARANNTQSRLSQLQAIGIDPESPEGLQFQANGRLPADAYQMMKAKQMRAASAPKIGAGLSNMNDLLKKYNDQSFESSVGPLQGATPDGLLNSIPINAARLWGEATNAAGGNASPTEVRSAIASGTETLAAAIKPLIRGPGEGPWTDADQARLVAIVGDLSTASTKEEYRRRLNNVRDSLKSNFDLNIPFDASPAQAAQPAQAQPSGALPPGEYIYNPQTGKLEPKR